MNPVKNIRLTRTGAYVPKKVWTNHDLSKKVETSDEWIFSRTGIKERHIAADNEACSDLCFKATKNLFAGTNFNTDNLELIIVATMTPDKIFPNTACILQKYLGNTNAACFSLEVACSGFLYALEIAVALLSLGFYKNALVVGAEKLSSLIDWNDRNTCILFGDGAAAFFLEYDSSVQNPFYLSSYLTANGSYEDILHVPLGGSRERLNQNNINNTGKFLQMNGSEVYKIAINCMKEACEVALKRAGLSISDIDWIVPHQANIRIINSISRKLGIEENKVFINLQYYGNTSAASIPLAFNELVQSTKLKRGQKVLFTALGGGLAWGASIIEY